jgi:hypothetical protein
VVVRFADGVLGEPGDADVQPIGPSSGDLTHAVTLPEGALAIEVTHAWTSSSWFARRAVGC